MKNTLFLQNEIALEPLQVTSDPSIESLSPMRRGCLFNDEQPENYTLKAHKKYTQVKLNWWCILILEHKIAYLQIKNYGYKIPISHSRQPARLNATFKKLLQQWMMKISACPGTTLKWTQMPVFAPLLKPESLGWWLTWCLTKNAR